MVPDTFVREAVLILSEDGLCYRRGMEIDANIPAGSICGWQARGRGVLQVSAGQVS
jgi:hypothetical protein